MSSEVWLHFWNLGSSRILRDLIERGSSGMFPSPKFLILQVEHGFWRSAYLTVPLSYGWGLWRTTPHFPLACGLDSLSLFTTLRTQGNSLVTVISTSRTPGFSSSFQSWHPHWLRRGIGFLDSEGHYPAELDQGHMYFYIFWGPR